MAVENIDVNSDDGRLKYLSLAAEIIAESPDVMTRDIYIGRLSEKYGVSKTALQAKVDELRKKNQRIANKKVITDIITPKYSSTDINPERRIYAAAAAAEETVIAILMQHPDFFDTTYESLKPDDMLTSLGKRIYTLVCECVQNGNALDISYFGQKLIPSELGFLVSLANSEKAGKNPLIVLKDSIKVILDEGIRKKALDVKDISDEDWAENLKKLIENKQKGN